MANENDHKSSSFCSALRDREIFGTIRGKLCNNTKSQFCNLISRKQPVEQVIPKTALQNGHIVMGFTTCNRYLLSYTVEPFMQPASLGHPFLHQDMESDARVVYKLHFWRFIPNKTLQVVASVELFDRNGVTDSTLLLHIFQWSLPHLEAGLENLIVVVGRSTCPEENPRCHLTLTQLPDSSPCQKCLLPYQRCHAHSLTLSLTYELVSPYPHFDPDTSLYVSCDDNNSRFPSFLINTGNMLHVVHYVQSGWQMSAPSSSTPASASALNTNFNNNNAGGVGERRRRQPLLKVLFHDAVVGDCGRNNIQSPTLPDALHFLKFFTKQVFGRRGGFQRNGLGREKGNRFFKRLRQKCHSSQPQEEQQFSTVKPNNAENLSESLSRPEALPASVYDSILLDDDLLKPRERFKTYRLFRQFQKADRAYEFVEDDDDPRGEVERSCPSTLSMERTDLKKSHKRENYSCHYIVVKKCVASVVRSFVRDQDDNDEDTASSATTEVEDLEYPFGSMLVALPLHIYTDQSQLSAVSNRDNGLNSRKLLSVVQTSLDIEILSNEVATFICSKQKMKFIFLIDYVPVVIQTLSDSVTLLITLQIQASPIATANSTSGSQSSNTRVKYETLYLLTWIPSTSIAHINLAPEQFPLTPVEPPQKPCWNPLPEDIKRLKLPRPFVLHLSNQKMVFDWKSVLELTDNYGITTVYNALAEEDDYDDDMSE